jgi:hypothetical protein
VQQRQRRCERFCFWPGRSKNSAVVPSTEVCTFFFCADLHAGIEPRQLYHVVQFLLRDQGKGSVDTEAVAELLYLQYGRVRNQGCCHCYPST